MKLTVNILLRHGKFILIKHLLDFSADDSNLSRDVINGSRTILDLLLVELHSYVHTHNKNGENIKDNS